MSAINVVYFSATNHRPTRYKASTMSARPFSVTISEPMEAQSDDERYGAALQALLTKMGWGDASEYIHGNTKDGRVYVRLPRAKGGR